jgi:hypothetical protein
MNTRQPINSLQLGHSGRLVLPLTPGTQPVRANELTLWPGTSITVVLVA